jgi:hypothetical protein
MPRRIPNILSLDLDWFNWIEASEHGDDGKKQMIMDFFAHLRLRCGLPSTAAYMTEHHYFYPWCVEVMKALSVRKVNVYNVDEHHDFYHLRDIEDFESNMVSCANFFAFMAHHRMINHYHWILNDDAVERRKKELRKEFRYSSSQAVKDVCKRFTVTSVNKVWSLLERKKFDGFAIVKSLDYTDDQDLVFPTVDTVMKRYFTPVHGVKVGRSLCRADYRPKQRPSLDVSSLLPV